MTTLLALIVTIMFDCLTNRTPIERLGSIGFDWFLVRFRSISYAGTIRTIGT